MWDPEFSRVTKLLLCEDNNPLVHKVISIPCKGSRSWDSSACKLETNTVAVHFNIHIQSQSFMLQQLLIWATAAGILCHLLNLPFSNGKAAVPYFSTGQIL